MEFTDPNKQVTHWVHKDSGHRNRTDGANSGYNRSAVAGT